MKKVQSVKVGLTREGAKVVLVYKRIPRPFDNMDGLDTIEIITQQVIDDTFAVNVRGSILMMREFIHHRDDYGRIINLSTDAAQVFAGQILHTKQARNDA